MNYKEKRDKIISYIKKGETSRKDYKNGLEMEHFIVDKESLYSYDYFSKEGVGDSLEKLKELGYKVTNKEDGYILGLRNDDVAINLEPAGQFEVAIDAKKNLGDLENSYKKVMKELIPIFEKNGQLLVALGYHPRTKINDLKIIPKDRYRYMQKYFLEYGGKTALNMMKGTASVQTAIDFSDQEDFKKKFFVANALSPFIYTIYDNSYIFESKPYKYRNLRQQIWQDCDPKRTGVYEFAFDEDLSYGKYADKILNTDSIFINKDGKDIYKADVKFSEIMDDDSSDDMIFHALSIVFPDVRLKRYIEIRMPDAVLYPYNFSFAALIKGLFYNEDNLTRLREDFSSMTYEKCEILKKECKNKGLFAKYENKEIYKWAEYFLDLAYKGLDDKEKIYLEPMKDLIKEKNTLRDKFKDLYDKNPKKAVERFSINYCLGGIDEA